MVYTEAGLVTKFNDEHATNKNKLFPFLFLISVTKQLSGDAQNLAYTEFWTQHFSGGVISIRRLAVCTCLSMNGPPLFFSWDLKPMRVLRNTTFLGQISSVLSIKLSLHHDSAI